MSSDQVERELKLGAWPEFVLPDLTGAIEGVKPGAAATRELDAIYHDTRDLHLLRRGATLRFRRGEPPGDVWTAKLPSDAAEHGLARREITVAGKRDAMPPLFADLARGWALGHRLAPVARVRTVRVSMPLCDEHGRVLATLDDDAVTVTRGRRVVARFRELEVELVGDAPGELIAGVDERLRAAGAEKVPQIPKLSRALGRKATLPWALATPELGPKPTMAAAAQAHLLASLARLVDLHALVALDVPGSAEHARIEAAALLVALRAFAPLFDPPLPDSRSLEWLIAELGPVAELDELLERTAAPRTRSALSDAGGAALAARIAGARQRARPRLRRALRDRRYTALLSALASALTANPSPSSAGKRRVASDGSKFVRAAWRELRDGASVPGAADPVIGRLRAALALASAMPEADGSNALDHVDRLAAASRERAESQALTARLRALTRKADSREAWAAGVAAGVELARASAATTAFESEWEEVTRKATWNWAD
jgi:inorganic triphosphatase YgiF